MICPGHFSTHTGLDVRPITIGPGAIRRPGAMCSGCRKAAADKGLDVAITDAAPDRLWITPPRFP